MRVGFDIGPITRARSGVGNYCLELLRALLEIDGLDVSGFAASTRRLDLEALGRPLARRHLPVPTRVMYQVWSLLGMPAVDSMLGGVDVYHATNYFLPPVKRAKRVLTIHDVAFKKHPELCSPKIVGPFSAKVAAFAREADAVIADSESTRTDTIKLLGVKPERVHTVRLAVDWAFRPMPYEKAFEIVEKKYDIRRPYLLFVGTIEPRKNLLGLLKAFRQVRSQYPHQLVIAGAKGWGFNEVSNLAYGDDWGVLGESLAIGELGVSGGVNRKLQDKLRQVIMTDYVEQMDMSALYRAADAFMFPSFYEGFGLPVLEAMACGCPVITANNSSLPEVGGDAAEYCDAHDVDSIADAMRRVLSSAELREQMTQRGFAQAAKFSWKQTAEQTAAVYRSVCG